ncbi:hypothetical protein BUALT_Bualt09G0085800 [Buddleja alternifolia]|uniref:Myb/SANT-like DNA-binding domain-containing protein n=1 Tax=Buddleja alternifolia TaxID=168488 RepID=A0AAV6X2E8_9LAMI|nr:hypothetical protein BUALT_Bualt09G0085800 [Buddleja alternifolia]
MESDAMGGGMYANVQPGMLGLEMSLHHQIPSQNPQNPRHMPHQHQNPQHPMMAYGHQEGDFAPQFSKQAYPFAAKSKNQSLTLSDDDVAENSADDAKRKMSPWQRMKWTDNMVRLLIMIVFYIGDEVGSEGNDHSSSKKKGGGVLQKKGKWKSVSRAMMERGFYVSPQQCEDKFNDLNKRYKRVNDILGKGTSCKVVENQSLLDSMDHLSTKLKEEVKKLLNSKHLFFREMCAYHNSCGHGGAGGSGSGAGGVHHSPPEVPAPQLQQQRCLHSTENAPVMPNLNRVENEGAKMAKGISSDDDDDDHDHDDDEGDDDNDDHDEDDDDEGGSRIHGHEEEINETDERSSRKRTRKGIFRSPLIEQLDGELMNILQDGRKSAIEKRHWMKSKLMGLDEERVGIQSRAFELEKQRLKWLKFSSKKEREMEREKLANERLKLENERMVLLIRQKELDLIDHHQHHQNSSNRRGDPSSITG